MPDRRLARVFPDANVLYPISAADLGQRISLEGPYRTLLRVAEVWARMEGRPLVVLDRNGDDRDPAVLWLTLGVDIGAAAWQVCEVAEMRLCARRSPRWTTDGRKGRGMTWIARHATGAHTSSGR